MESDNELDMRKMVNQQNKKNKKSGGFQSMGLSQSIYRGILRKGYKVPTPIQRKCIPIILDGKDVVAMARTGSGKTAAFLIPLYERLRTRSAAAGARALILSPTRELAQQTWKFSTEIGKFTDLKAVTIFGGDRMEDQFSAIHEKPDIIIATPGRFLHVVMEMDLKFSAVEYVVFDEADRLFEMGFQDQLQEIINRLPDSRQTLLFSATLPKLLVDFAKAGLRDPTLVRLDVDNKLSDNLKSAFVGCRSEDKTAVLLHILRDVVKPDELTVVFLATKHHVEYLSMVLEKAGISCTYIYSSLDQAARRMNVGDFQRRKARVLLVTDLAARGIDIPLLDNVINYNFPAKSKLFVHRVGRVARAGRFGTAYSLVSPEELPYMMDLQLFLGRTMKYAKLDGSDRDWNGMYGTVLQSIVDDEDEQLQFWHSSSVDLMNMKRVCSNAYKQYVKSRPLSSSESVRRMKDDMKLFEIGIHPIFGVAENNLEKEKARFLENMKTYKPTATIFEIGSTVKNQSGIIMNKVRQIHSRAVQKHHNKLTEMKAENENREESRRTPNVDGEAQEDYIKEAFSTVLVQRKRKSGIPYQVKKKQKKTEDFKDKEYYLPYKAADHFAEQGLGLEKPTFEQQASNAVLDFTLDDADQLRKNQLTKKWDRKKKKFVGDGGNDKKVKKIKTESGVWIPASYKSDLYHQWQKREKSDFQHDDDDDDGEQNKPGKGKAKFQSKNGKPIMRRNDPGSNRKSRPAKRELKTKEEIFKNRKVKAKKQFHSKQQNAKKSKKGSGGGGGGGGGKRGGGGGGGSGGGKRGGGGGGGGKRRR